MQNTTVNATKISVIMPVYNTEDFVGKAIESILSQSFSDFEFIIIDDGSVDLSYQICEKYAKDDSRIRLYKNDKNEGITYTRNKLINLSTTNYIASQDSDDISMPERLKLSYNFLEKRTDYSVVSGNNIIINESGSVIGYRKYITGIKSVILKKSPISQGSSMFRKDIFLKLGGYDESLNFAEDYDLWLRMYSKNYGIGNIDNYLYKVRIREGQSKSESLKETIRHTIDIQNRAILKYNITPNISDKVYHLGEKVLLLLPVKFVLFLFKRIEYKHEK